MEKIYLEDFSGCFYTKSGFINNYCTCSPIKLTFFPGINVLYGDVDQGGGGISYAMSMLGKNKKDILLDQSSKIYIDNKMCTWKDINMLSCYIDTNYHLFQKNITIEKNIIRGLKKSISNNSFQDIKELFDLSSDRCMRSVQQTGNESLRGMSAIGYAYGKLVYCFPWISKKMVKYYGNNLFFLLEILNSLNVFVILPTNYDFSQYRVYRFYD